MGLDHLLSEGAPKTANAYPRSGLDLALDAVLGVSVWIWAAGLFLHEGGPPLSVRLSVAALNGAVGMLFLARGAARASGGISALLAALPSIALGGLALRLSPEAWPLACEVAFVVATAGALAALLSLGRSFSILPVRRAVVGRGAYALVRHPAYACELAMVIAAGAAHSTLAAIGLGLAVGLALAPRIGAEETLLAVDPAWRVYAGRVRFRLVPGLW
jgi:protein-S-isoprenylcysteine O-methyltransferase Ste14